MGSGTSGGADPFPRVALSCVTVTLRICCGTGKVTLLAENRGDVCLHELQITACRRCPYVVILLFTVTLHLHLEMTDTIEAIPSLP